MYPRLVYTTATLLSQILLLKLDLGRGKIIGIVFKKTIKTTFFLVRRDNGLSLEFQTFLKL